jgi:hypothetical protein
MVDVCSFSWHQVGAGRDPEVIGELYNLHHGATFGSLAQRLKIEPIMGYLLQQKGSPRSSNSQRTILCHKQGKSLIFPKQSGCGKWFHTSRILHI